MAYYEFKKLDEIKNKYEELHNQVDKPQNRGFDLEALIDNYRRIKGYEGSPSIRNAGNQDDGHIKFDQRWYIYEAKWEKNLTNNSEVQMFRGKLDTNKGPDVYGLFISVAGFSDGILDTLKNCKRIFILNNEDLKAIFLGAVDLKDLVYWKEKQVVLKQNYFCCINDYLKERNLKPFEPIRGKIINQGKVPTFVGNGVSCVSQPFLGRYDIYFDSWAVNPIPNIEVFGTNIGPVIPNLQRCSSSTITVDLFSKNGQRINSDFYIKVDEAENK